MQEPKLALRIFLTNWLLIGVILAVNVYLYLDRRAAAFLLMSVFCGIVFVGWALAYVFYFSKPDKKPND